MRTIHRMLIVGLCLMVSLGITSCSDVQNREKNGDSKDSTQGTIALKITGRSTTTDSATSLELDSNVEKKITKALSRLLIVGATDEKLFTSEAAINASSTFKNNKTAQDNEVAVSYSYLANADPALEVVVAEISQEITDSENRKFSRNGKIYFDSNGIVVGFDLPDQLAPEVVLEG